MLHFVDFRVGLMLLLGCAAPLALAADGDAPGRFEVPAWLFPIPPAAGAPAAGPVARDEARRLSIPGSVVTFTLAQTRDYFAVPDWLPGSHPPMPEVVEHGRRPGLYACGFCHLPDGAGRPENATLAGLPAGYIVDQMAAFASGARRSAWTGPAYLPSALMIRSATEATLEEVAAAAAYFSMLPLRAPRAEVIETDRVPKTRAVAWIHATTGEAGEEPLGTRLIELPRDFERHELRDPNTPYVAYVPRGSVALGRRLATEGTAAVPSCAGCHGEGLRGIVAAPPLAGRSPTYLLRQLVAFRTGARVTREGASMRPVVDALTLEEMIALAAYAASLPP